jgi:NTP pyrophosphatase (non-canonical NTP hydrolase)
MIDKLFKIAKALNNRFPDGDDPFKIVTRLAEECGEVAAEVSHFEGQGVKMEKLGAPDRMKMAKEMSDVIGAILHLVLYYNLEEELAASVDSRYNCAIAEGLVEPLPGKRSVLRRV